jgi:HSP20 family protein
MSRSGGSEPTRGSTLLQPSDLFEDLLGGWLSRGQEQRSWMPAVDIEETDEAYLVAAELPGMGKDDVEITVDNNILTLGGERKWEKEEGGGKNRQLHRVERGYGRFVRSFALPRRVDPEKIGARFENGVLHVTIPKEEGARVRKVPIS